MELIRRWKTGAATMMAMAITTGAVAPMFILSPANAQYRIGQPRSGIFNNRDITISRGARIPTTYEKDKILLAPGETMENVKLRVASNLIDRNGGNVLIPRDSIIRGKFVPVRSDDYYRNDRDYRNDRNDRNDRDSKVQGARFIAEEIVLPSGQTQRLDASSDTITRTEKIRRGANTGEFLRDAGYGAAAAAVISLVTGNKKIEWGELLIGGGAGSIYRLIKGGREADLISVDTERDLTLRLDSPLTVSSNRTNY